jgi:hypothetical protein
MSVDQGAKDREGSGFHDIYRTWRYLFWIIGLAGVVLVFYAEENWRGHRAWESYKRRMMAQGEDFSPSAFIPPPVPDDENFAMTPTLAPLFDFVPGTQQWRNTSAPRLFDDQMARYNAAASLVKPSRSTRLNSWVHDRTDLNLWAAAFSDPIHTKGRKHELLLATNFSSRDAAAKVLEGLADLKPVLDELRDASSRPHSRFNLRYDQDNPAAILLPHLAKIKGLCQVLQLRALADLALSRTDDALQDLRLMFYLTDTSREEPILISQLVRMAELQIALQPLAEGIGLWSEPQLREIQDRLQRFDFCFDFKRALQAERVLFGGGMIEYVRRSKNNLRLLGELERVGPSDNSDGFFPAALLFAFGPSGWLYLEQRNNSRNFDQYLLPLIDLKERQIRPEAVAEAETALGRVTAGTPVSRVFQHEFFSALLLPATSKLCQKAAFAQTAVDTAAVACALERYRLKHGQLPDSLNSLAPDFVTNLPHDIINSQPLRYHTAADGHYALYSVGWNQKDDGGVVQSSKGVEPDQMRGDPNQKEGDWVWTDNF